MKFLLGVDESFVFLGLFYCVSFEDGTGIGRCVFFDFESNMSGILIQLLAFSLRLSDVSLHQAFDTSSANASKLDLERELVWSLLALFWS